MIEYNIFVYSNMQQRIGRESSIIKSLINADLELKNSFVIII